MDLDDNNSHLHCLTCNGQTERSLGDSVMELDYQDDWNIDNSPPIPVFRTSNDCVSALVEDRRIEFEI